MSTVQIATLFAVCAAFVIFAVALAWGDYQTRKMRHNPPPQPKAAPSAKLQMLRTETTAPLAPAAASRAEMAK